MDIDPNIEYLNPAIVQLEPAAKSLLTSRQIRNTLNSRDELSAVSVFHSFRSRQLDANGDIVSELFSTLEIGFINSNSVDVKYVDSRYGINIVYEIPIDASLDERIVLDVENGRLVLNEPAKGLLEDLSRSLVEALGDHELVAPTR